MLCLLHDKEGDFPMISFPGKIYHSAHKEKASCALSCDSSIHFSNENWQGTLHRKTAPLSVSLSVSPALPPTSLLSC